MTLDDIFGLKGRTALVTGSTRGIGAAIAEGLCVAGARVAIHGTRADQAEICAKRLRGAGHKAEALASDLSVPGAGEALIDAAEAAIGPLDILVINASAQINATLADLTPQDLDFQIAVNLRSTAGMLQACLPRMAARRWGRVVNIGSINQIAPKPVVTAYAATKAAQHNLIQSQARDYARTGVVLNTLAPGLIDTDRNADRKTGDPQAWAAYCDGVNWMGRAGESHEMIGAAIFLASQACNFMTGETIVLSGGG
ncbi:MAG: SDR family NAD(P)-dependent oxidoreductase [Pseudorhodobacter sp.]